MVEQHGRRSLYRRMQHSRNLLRKSFDSPPHLLLVARQVRQASIATIRLRVNLHPIQELSNSLLRSVHLVPRYCRRRNRSTSLLNLRSTLDHYPSELSLSGTVVTRRMPPTRRASLPLSRQSSSVPLQVRRLELRASRNFRHSPQTTVEPRLISLD